MPPRLNDLSYPRIDALNGIGRIDHAPHVRRKSEERNHLRPGAPPTGRHSGELLSPWTILEGRQFRLCRVGARCRVDGLDCRSKGLAVLPAGVVQAIADQMH